MISDDPMVPKLIYKWIYRTIQRAFNHLINRCIIFDTFSLLIYEVSYPTMCRWPLVVPTTLSQRRGFDLPAMIPTLLSLTPASRELRGGLSSLMRRISVIFPGVKSDGWLNVGRDVKESIHLPLFSYSRAQTHNFRRWPELAPNSSIRSDSTPLEKLIFVRVGMIARLFDGLSGLAMGWCECV